MISSFVLINHEFQVTECLSAYFTRRITKMLRCLNADRSQNVYQISSNWQCPSCQHINLNKEILQSNYYSIALHRRGFTSTPCVKKKVWDCCYFNWGQISFWKCPLSYFYRLSWSYILLNCRWWRPDDLVSSNAKNGTTSFHLSIIYSS